MSLRVYSDSSGKLENHFMALAAFSGNDEIWAKFETDWREILSANVPKAEYIHMKEVSRQMGEFDWRKGWNQQLSFGLVNKCLSYMSQLDKDQFHMFYCGIDLDAWRKLKLKFPDIIDPIGICNRYCSEIVLTLHLLKYPEYISDPDVPVEDVHYFFDRNEYFKQPFQDKLNAEKDRSEKWGRKGLWDCIKQVSAVDMKEVPGVQAADILAWAVNRENTALGNLPGVSLSHIMKQVIPSHYVIWDEEYMQERIHLLKAELPPAGTLSK
jgi:Protein of unknown function (DUF3800)